MTELISQERLTELYSAAISQALDAGLILPITLVWISANAQLCAFRFSLVNGKLVSVILCQHLEETALDPVNLFMTDQRGRFLRLLLDETSELTVN